MIMKSLIPLVLILIQPKELTYARKHGNCQTLQLLASKWLENSGDCGRLLTGTPKILTSTTLTTLFQLSLDSLMTLKQAQDNSLQQQWLSLPSKSLKVVVPPL